MTKLAITSDLHGNLPNIEPCDILLVCGDIFPLHIQTSMPHCKMWLKGEFSDWCNSIPAKEIVLIAGNHDFYFARNLTFELNTNKVRYLQDAEVTIDGIRIYGTPWCHQFGNWAFMLSDDGLTKYYEQIPEGLDILITHDALSIGNLGLTEWLGEFHNAGNKVLTKYVLERKPKMYFCGHIHDGNHKLQTIEGIQMANVSLLDNTYSVTYPVLYYDYEGSL